MLNRRKLLRTMAAASLLLAPASWTAAYGSDTYPSRVVTFVVAYPPGGGADILARVLAKRLTEVWAQPVVVMNKSGAFGTIAANAVGSSTPDGHTLLVGASGMFALDNTKTLAKTLAPTSLLSAPPVIIAVNASLPVSSLGELVAYAKARPEKVTFASSGAGSSTHLAGELFMGLTQTRLTHIPYKGMGQAIQDLVGGTVTLMFGPPPVLLPHIKSGRLKSLAVASRQRSPLFPDIPTAAEAGVSGFEAGLWFGVFAPAKTPREIVTKVSADTARALRSPEIEQTLASGGSTPIGSSPEEFAQFLEADTALWGNVLRKAGVTPQ